MDYGIQARVILRANGTVDLKMQGGTFSLLGNDVAEIVKILGDRRKKHLERKRVQKEAETVPATEETKC